MESMGDAELRAFLLHGTRTGKLATVRGDGRPHLTPIWFILDGDSLVFTTWHDTVKAGNIGRDPRVAVCVDDETFPYAFALLEGKAQLEALSPEELLPWTTAIARRYVGEERAEAFGKRNAVEGELLVRVTVEKTIASKDVAG